MREANNEKPKTCEDCIYQGDEGLSFEYEPKTNPKGEVSLKSESQTKLKPYLAAGASYTVMPGVKVVGSADWFSYSVEGVSGTARALSLGAEVAF